MKENDMDFIGVQCLAGRDAGDANLFDLAALYHHQRDTHHVVLQEGFSRGIQTQGAVQSGVVVRPAGGQAPLQRGQNPGRRAETLRQIIRF